VFAVEDDAIPLRALRLVNRQRVAVIELHILARVGYREMIEEAGMSRGCHGSPSLLGCDAEHDRAVVGCLDDSLHDPQAAVEKSPPIIIPKTHELVAVGRAA